MVVLDTVRGPVRVGVKAAAEGPVDQPGWGGSSVIRGRPPPGILEPGSPAAEPADSFVYKSPPFLLFLLSPSPHLPSFLNSSQTTPAFVLSEGRVYGWVGGRRLVLGGNRRRGGRSGPRAGVGREASLGGKGAILVSSPSPHAGAPPCVLLDG